MKKIIDCALPLPIQKLYIKRLKHMIERWEYDNFCGHCPVNRHFKGGNSQIEQFKTRFSLFSQQVCDFCHNNVDAKGCPCSRMEPKEALKRAKDFIRRFELKHSKKATV